MELAEAVPIGREVQCITLYLEHALYYEGRISPLDYFHALYMYCEGGMYLYCIDQAKTMPCIVKKGCPYYIMLRHCPTTH